MIVIVDAGPPLHLCWVGVSAWALPPQVIDVVAEVWAEVETHAPEALHDPRLRRVIAPSHICPELSPWRVDRGELAALAYAVSQRDQGEVLLLCDEHEARRACAALSL